MGRVTVIRFESKGTTCNKERSANIWKRSLVLMFSTHQHLYVWNHLENDHLSCRITNTARRGCSCCVLWWWRQPETWFAWRWYLVLRITIKHEASFYGAVVTIWSRWKRDQSDNSRCRPNRRFGTWNVCFVFIFPCIINIYIYSIVSIAIHIYI